MENIFPEYGIESNEDGHLFYSTVYIYSQIGDSDAYHVYLHPVKYLFKGELTEALKREFIKRVLQVIRFAVPTTSEDFPESVRSRYVGTYTSLELVLKNLY